MPYGENFSQVEIAWTSFDRPAALFRYSNTGGVNKETKIHPTQKPIALYEWLLGKYAQEGYKILDTHVGSASSLIACKKAGLRYVGFEKDEGYFLLAKERMEEFDKQPCGRSAIAGQQRRSRYTAFVTVVKIGLWSKGGGKLKYSEQIEGFLDFLRKVKTDYNIAVSCEKEANDATQDLLHRLELYENTYPYSGALPRCCSSREAATRNAQRRQRN